VTDDTPCNDRVEQPVFKVGGLNWSAHALVASRPYRAPIPHEQAVGMIRAQRGTHFDPAVVDAFVAAEREIGALSETLRN
jgi:hypothetical protein